MSNAPQRQAHGHMHALWTNNSHRLVKGNQKTFSLKSVGPHAQLLYLLVCSRT